MTQGADSTRKIGCIFEDAAQRDFCSGLVRRRCQEVSLSVALSIEITSGCRFDYLKHHLRSMGDCDAILIGVDAGRWTARAKRAALSTWFGKERIEAIEGKCVFALPEPCIEEWMMADPTAVVAALRERYTIRHTPRPAFSRSEQRTKELFGQWVESLLRFPPQRNGKEYAEDIAHAVDPARLQGKRAGALLKFVQSGIPTLLGVDA